MRAHIGQVDGQDGHGFGGVVLLILSMRMVGRLAMGDFNDNCLWSGNGSSYFKMKFKRAKSS